MIPQKTKTYKEFSPERLAKLKLITGLKSPSEIELLKHVDKVEEQFKDQLSVLDKKIDVKAEEILASFPTFEEVVGAIEVPENGEQGIRGERGPTGIGIQGPKGDKGDTTIVEKIIERTEIIKEPIITNQIVKEVREVAIAENAEQIVEKVNASKVLIEPSQVKGLKDIENIARNNATPVTTSFFNGLRAKNLTIVGATAVQQGDTVSLTVPSSSSSSGYQKPTAGVVDGSNKTFTWATAPNVIITDQGRAMQKVSSDGTVNWTGTLTTVLSIAPNFDLYALA